MKKRSLLCLLISATVLAGYGQGLTQSADGKSTVLAKGAVVSLDLAKTDLSFGVNNYDKAAKKKDKVNPLLGASVKVKNEEGIGNLFSAGSLVPSGNLGLFAGFTFSPGKAEAAEYADVQALSDHFTKWAQDFRQETYDSLVTVIESQCASIPDPSLRKQTLGGLLSDLEKSKATPEVFDDMVVIDPKESAEVREAKTRIQALAKERAAVFTAKRGEFQAQNMVLTKQSHHRIKPSRFSVFAFGGISAIAFKKFNGIDSANLSKSFQNIYQQGGNFGIGVNYQCNQFWFGATYSYESSNNFSQLTKTDYTLRTTTTVNNQSLIQENKITGYSGKYGKVELNEFDIDLVYDWWVDKKAQAHVLLNPYLRASIFSRDTSLLTNKTNVGMGFYFFQKKFLGGFYIELPDINNNQEKAKPPGQQDLRPPFQRISFGVVTKFNLTTLFSQ